MGIAAVMDTTTGIATIGSADRGTGLLARQSPARYARKQVRAARLALVIFEYARFLCFFPSAGGTDGPGDPSHDNNHATIQPGATLQYDDRR